MYRKRSSSTYAQRRSRRLGQTTTFYHHYSFRSEWESNLERALAEMEPLKNEGFLVEDAVERGTFTESQAKRIAAERQARGYEVKTVPVAKWAGENVVFIVYKPPKEPVPEPQPQPKTAPAKTRKPRPPPEELANQFAQLTWVKSNKDPTEEVDRFKREGWMMDPMRVMAFISKDATPKASDDLIGMLKDFQAGKYAPLGTMPNAKNFITALRRARTRYRYVKFGVGIYADIDYLRGALRLFGNSDVRVYCKDKERPIYFVDSEGNAVAVAPAIDVIGPTIDVQTLMAQYGS